MVFLPFTSAVCVLAASSTTLGQAAAIWSAVALFAATFCYHRFYRSDPLSDAERRAVDQSIALIESTGFGDYARVARQRWRQIRSSNRLRHWGYTPPTFRTTVLRTDAVAMDTRLLASLLLHELVHSTQLAWPMRGTASWEHQAYDVQSRFMKALGIEGQLPDAFSLVLSHPAHRAYMLDQAESMARYGVKSPALKVPKKPGY